MHKVYKRSVKEEALKEVETIDSGCWINIVDPSKEELEKISADFKLDREMLEDGLDENELSWIERENNTVYTVLRTPLKNNGAIATVPLMVVISEKEIITLSRTETEVLNCFLSGKKKIFTTQKTLFLLSVLLETINRFDYYLKQVSKDIKSKKINLKKLNNDDVLMLVHAEETMNDFISSFVPLRSVLNKVLGGKYIQLYEKDKDVIEDLVDDSKQTLELCEVNLKSIKNIREAYSTIITNNLNKVIKFLTTVTIILTIPTIIASIYGMNVNLPIGKNFLAFYYILGFTVLLCAVVWFVLWKKKWL